MATAAAPTTLTEAVYTTAGQYFWVCPAGVTSISVVCVGAGGGNSGNGRRGPATGSTFGRNISGYVAGDSFWGNTTIMKAGGGAPATGFQGTAAQAGGSFFVSTNWGTSRGGGNGGRSGPPATNSAANGGSGGGGAAGYLGTGGHGAGGWGAVGRAPADGQFVTGGGAGGSTAPYKVVGTEIVSMSGGGGGVGLYGVGANGVPQQNIVESIQGSGGGSGGGSSSGTTEGTFASGEGRASTGGLYGGGSGSWGGNSIGGSGGGLAWISGITTVPGTNYLVVVGGGDTSSLVSKGFSGGSADGAVRIIWGPGKSFPNNAGV